MESWEQVWARITRGPTPPRTASEQALREVLASVPCEAGDALRRVDPAELDQAGRCALAWAWERHARWVESRRLRALAAAAPVDPIVAEAMLPPRRRSGADSPEESAALAARSDQAELSAAMALPSRSLGAQLLLARTLVTLLPSTLALLSFGQVGASQARAMAGACEHLTEEQACEVEQRVLPHMVLLKGEQALRARIAAAVLAVTGIDPAEERRRERQAEVARRGLWLEGRRSGLVDLVLSGLDPVVGAGVVAGLRREAAGHPAEGVTLDQRVADLALERLLGRGGVLPTAEVQVLVRLESLQGTSQEPAMVAGVGPLPPELLPDVLATSPMRRLLVDEQGRLHQVGPRWPPPPPTAARAGHHHQPERPPPGPGPPGPGPPVTAEGMAARLAVLRSWVRPEQPPPLHRAALQAPDPRIARAITEPADAGYAARLDACPERREPGDELARHVRARDRRCRFPGCAALAQRSDADHQNAWADGGPTTMANLHCLCRYHHRVRHLPGWRVRTEPGGTTVWQTPHGLTLRVPATDQRLLDA